MRMDPRLLRIFVAVGDRLSFSRAAADLHIAQPWLSTQIRKLETQLGFDLFARTSRRVVLTEEGETLLREAREVVAALDRLDLTARALANAEAGHLRIGLPEYSHNFPIRVALLEGFSRQHPISTWRSRPGGRRFCCRACARAPSTSASPSAATVSRGWRPCGSGSPR
jgi:DNA-binding transcriptional LysR family regulator